MLDQLGNQLVAVGATMAYSFVVTFVILKVLDMVMGLRVSEEEEIVGLDVSQHGERAYLLDGGAPLRRHPGRLDRVAATRLPVVRRSAGAS